MGYFGGGLWGQLCFRGRGASTGPFFGGGPIGLFYWWGGFGVGNLEGGGVGILGGFGDILGGVYGDFGGGAQGWGSEGVGGGWIRIPPPVLYPPPPPLQEAEKLVASLQEDERFGGGSSLRAPPRALPLAHEAARKWFYRDPQGDIQGGTPPKKKPL